MWSDVSTLHFDQTFQDGAEEVVAVPEGAVVGAEALEEPQQHRSQGGDLRVEHALWEPHVGCVGEQLVSALGDGRQDGVCAGSHGALEWLAARAIAQHGPQDGVVPRLDLARPHFPLRLRDMRWGLAVVQNLLGSPRQRRPETIAKQLRKWLAKRVLVRLEELRPETCRQPFQQYSGHSHEVASLLSSLLLGFSFALHFAHLCGAMKCNI